MARELQARLRRRIGALRLGAGERRALELVELRGGEGRLAQHLGDQAQRGQPALAPSPPSETLALSFSNAFLISARLFFCVPRISMPPAKLHATSRSVRVFSSPQCSVSVAMTRPPRVVFGSSAAWMPLERFLRTTRDSMFFGEGSKASPRRTPCDSPLNASSAACHSCERGMSARSGASVGMNVPSTRFAGLR